MPRSDHKLPGTITALTPQKNNKSRYAVFVDNEFLIGVAGSTLLKHDLAKGDKVTPALYRILQRDEGRQVVKSYFLKLLSRRDHARRELRDKARRKDYTDDIIIDVLDELEGKDFINDKAFAKKFARDKNHLNNWGPYKIKAHLRKKNIAKQIREEAVEEAFESVDLESTFKELIKKRKRHFLREQDNLKRKKKVISYLQQKGYRPANIYKFIDELMHGLDDER